MPLADLSLWNWAPNDNGLGPGVANLQGTEAYVRSTDALSPGFGTVKADGEAAPAPTGFCRWLASVSPDIARMFCPAYQSQTERQAGTDYQGKPSGFVPPPGSHGADVGEAINATTAAVIGNKSLWILAGMILLFVVLIAVLRTR